MTNETPPMPEASPMTETVPLEEQDASISLNDLALAVRIIDLSVERGGIKGNEATTVGSVRDRLAKFVEIQNAKNIAAKTATEQPPV